MAMASGESTDTSDSLNNGRINVPASLFYPEEVLKDNIQEMLVDRGYFTVGDDGTFLAVTSYTSGYDGLLDTSEINSSGASDTPSQT